MFLADDRLDCLPVSLYYPYIALLNAGCYNLVNC